MLANRIILMPRESYESSSKISLMHCASVRGRFLSWRGLELDTLAVLYVFHLLSNTHRVETYALAGSERNVCGITARGEW